MKIYMFRTVPVFIIRNLFTDHSAMVCAIPVWRQLSSRTARKLSSDRYSIYHCWMYGE